MPRNRSNETRIQRNMHRCMQELIARGLADQALLVNAAADLAGGDEAAKMIAQGVYDDKIKTYEAN
jgi:hypothetical protein